MLVLAITVFVVCVVVVRSVARRIMMYIIEVARRVPPRVTGSWAWARSQPFRSRLAKHHPTLFSLATDRLDPRKPTGLLLTLVLGANRIRLASLAHASSYRDRSLHVTSPHGDAQATWVIVTRVKRYAGNLMLVPEADLEQSQLYVLGMSGSGPLSRARQLSVLAIGYLRHDPGVSVECVDSVKIDGDQSIPVQIDGEVLIGKLPLEISIHPKRLRLIWPAG